VLLAEQVGEAEVGVRNGLPYDPLFEVSLSLAGLREGRLKPMRVGV